LARPRRGFPFFARIDPVQRGFVHWNLSGMLWVYISKNLGPLVRDLWRLAMLSAFCRATSPRVPQIPPHVFLTASGKERTDVVRGVALRVALRASDPEHLSVSSSCCFQPLETIVSGNAGINKMLAHFARRGSKLLASYFGTLGAKTACRSCDLIEAGNPGKDAEGAL